jgi:hypothetical protein
VSLVVDAHVDRSGYDMFSTLLQAPDGGEVKEDLSDMWKEEDPGYKFPQFYPGKKHGKVGGKTERGPKKLEEEALIKT